jgi:hypothetical protein
VKPRAGLELAQAPFIASYGAVCFQAEAEAAEAAERQRLQALAEEVKAFNELKLMQLTEQERQERYDWHQLGVLLFRPWQTMGYSRT